MGVWGLASLPVRRSLFRSAVRIRRVRACVAPVLVTVFDLSLFRPPWPTTVDVSKLLVSSFHAYLGHYVTLHGQISPIIAGIFPVSGPQLGQVSR